MLLTEDPTPAPHSFMTLCTFFESESHVLQTDLDVHAEHDLELLLYPPLPLVWVWRQPWLSWTHSTDQAGFELTDRHLPASTSGALGLHHAAQLGVILMKEVFQPGMEMNRRDLCLSTAGRRTHAAHRTHTF